MKTFRTIDEIEKHFRPKAYRKKKREERLAKEGGTGFAREFLKNLAKALRRMK